MSKQSTAWKNLERTAAKKLGGIRIVRGDDFSQSLLDIEHPFWAVDCKYRSTLALEGWYTKLCEDNKKLYPDQGKIPILVVKKRGMRGELVVISIDDFLKVIKDEYKTQGEE